MLGDPCIEKANPDPAAVTAMHPPTTNALIVAPQYEFVAKPLDASRDADVKLHDMEIWIIFNTVLKVSRYREGEFFHPLFMPVEGKNAAHIAIARPTINPTLSLLDGLARPWSSRFPAAQHRLGMRSDIRA